MEISFAFVADNRQIGFLPPLVRSLEHFHPGSRYYVLTMPGTDASGMLRSLGPVAGDRIHVMVENEPIVTEYFAFGRVTAATFLKISLFRDLPPDVDRFIYLDIDMICAGPLDEAWTALDTNPCAAVPSPWTSAPAEDGIWIPNENRHTMCPGFFAVKRSGFPDAYEKGREYVLTHDMKKQIGEIDALLSVIGKGFHRLPQPYHFQCFFVCEGRIMSNFRFQRYLEQCPKEKLKLIHYGGECKPWNSKPLYHAEWDRWNAMCNET